MFEPLSCENVITVDGIVSAFYYHCDPEFYFGGESHDFWEFIFADRGEITINTGPSRYELHQGELVFIKPGEFHTVEAANKKGASFFVCSFYSASPSIEGFSQLIYPLGEKERRQLRETAAAAKKAFGSDFTSSPNSGPGIDFALNPTDYQYFKNSLELFLLTVLSLYSLPIETRLSNYRQQILRSQLADAVKSMLVDQIHQRISLGLISSKLGFSVSLLKKEYKAATGKSIISDFLDLKILHAQHMLIIGEATHTQIAHSLGYMDERYFFRLFRQKTGMTMTQYANSIEPQ